MWRACHNLLPTKMNLHRRGICEEAQSLICFQEEETVEHIVWECPSTSDVWGANIIKIQKCRRGWGDFQQLLLEVVKRCDPNEVELFMVIARKLWMHRNHVVFGGDFNLPNQLLLEAEMMLKDFRHSNSSTIQTLTSSPHTEEEKWVPPPRNTVKINWGCSCGHY